jgi:hypothetical protein
MKILKFSNVTILLALHCNHREEEEEEEDDDDDETPT